MFGNCASVPDIEVPKVDPISAVAGTGGGELGGTVEVVGVGDGVMDGVVAGELLGDGLAVVWVADGVGLDVSVAVGLGTLVSVSAASSTSRVCPGSCPLAVTENRR